MDEFGAVVRQKATVTVVFLPVVARLTGSIDPSPGRSSTAFEGV